MQIDGTKLRKMQEDLRLTPAEICVEASISMGTLYNVYANRRVTTNSVNRVQKAIEALRIKLRNETIAG
jgi:predicted transcriptional regulator